MFRNVGIFTQGDDDLHWIGIDFSIEGPDGNIVDEITNVLGEDGHLEIPNGIAESPFVNFKSKKRRPSRNLQI